MINLATMLQNCGGNMRVTSIYRFDISNAVCESCHLKKLMQREVWNDADNIMVGMYQIFIIHTLKSIMYGGNVSLK